MTKRLEELREETIKKIQSCGFAFGSAAYEIPLMVLDKQLSILAEEVEKMQMDTIYELEKFGFMEAKRFFLDLISQTKEK